MVFPHHVVDGRQPLPVADQRRSEASETIFHCALPARELVLLRRIRRDTPDAESLRAQCRAPRRAIRLLRPTKPTLPRSSKSEFLFRPSAPGSQSRPRRVSSGIAAALPIHQIVARRQVERQKPMGPLRRFFGSSQAATGGVQDCHSGVSERPHPRERSPPKPESASSRNALRTRASHFSRRGVRELHHRPKSGVRRELQARCGVRFHFAGFQTIHARRSIARRCGTVRARHHAGSGIRSRHPPPSDFRRCLSRPAAIPPRQ